MKKTVLYLGLIGTLLSTNPNVAEARMLAKKQFIINGQPTIISYTFDSCACEAKAEINVYKEGSRGLLCEPERTYVCDGTVDKAGYFQPTGCNGIPSQSVLEQLVQRVR